MTQTIYRNMNLRGPRRRATGAPKASNQTLFKIKCVQPPCSMEWTEQSHRALHPCAGQAAQSFGKKPRRKQSQRDNQFNPHGIAAKHR
jgi:hypothetical protein